jgi:glycosyltransferase involved in cell wall biosynthesis
VFPEAFGMVAAEAAAAGCPPIVARHSGLAEIAAGLEAFAPARLERLSSFSPGDPEDLRARLLAVLALPPGDRAALRAASRRAVEERWSWSSVARRLLELSTHPEGGRFSGRSDPSTLGPDG